MDINVGAMSNNLSRCFPLKLILSFLGAVQRGEVKKKPRVCLCVCVFWGASCSFRAIHGGSSSLGGLSFGWKRLGESRAFSSPDLSRGEDVARHLLRVLPRVVEGSTLWQLSQHAHGEPVLYTEGTDLAIRDSPRRDLLLDF